VRLCVCMCVLLNAGTAVACIGTTGRAFTCQVNCHSQNLKQGPLHTSPATPQAAPKKKAAPKAKKAAPAAAE
jgi:hypothetical protein